MSKERLQKLAERIERLKNQAKKIESSEKRKERKRDTRMKILMGACLTEMIKKDSGLKKRFDQSLDAMLTRKEDREMFGLEAAPAQSAPNSGQEAVA